MSRESRINPNPAMLEHLSITRVAVHEVLTNSEFDSRDSLTSDHILDLNDQGEQLICERLADCLGSKSHCVDLTVERASEGSVFQRSVRLLKERSKGFIGETVLLAADLSRAQTIGSIKAGLAVFMQGTGWDGEEQLRWVCIMKADPDKALVKTVKKGSIDLEFVSDLIMGAQQRLLKVAFIVEQVEDSSSDDLRDSKDFSVKVYDHLMSNTGRGTAARYFYSGFLGCKLAENAAKRTRDFYEETKRFIDSMGLSPRKKVDLRGHLVSYLKSEKSRISVSEFAETYLSSERRNAYQASMKEQGIPDTAISKDTSLVKSRLRKQTLRFSSSIMMFASPEAIKNSINIGKVEVLKGEKWTNLKIKGELESQP